MATIAKPLLLDETYREGNAALINILENITTATDKAAEATASADIATQKADIATIKADAASTSATNAAQSYANADAVATQLTEYLATKETLTAPAVDKTLLIEGAAADSKVVGELRGDLIDNINEKLSLEQGYYAIINGDKTESNTWCRTSSYIPKDYDIELGANYTMFLLAFENGNYIGYYANGEWTKTYNVANALSYLDISVIANKFKTYDFVLNFYNNNTYCYPNEIAQFIKIRTTADKVVEADDFEVILPYIGIYTTQGKSRNVYYDNILNKTKKEDIYMNFGYEDVWSPQKDFLRFSEAQPIGYKYLAFNACKKYPIPYVYGEKPRYAKVGFSKTMNADTNSGNGLTKKILVIGDSMTASGAITGHLLQLFENDVMNIELIGTLASQWNANNKHEGRGGWRAWNYAFELNASGDGVQSDTNNPFYNSATQKFDFSMYMSNQGYSDVDYVFINLGTNDRARNTHNSDDDILLAYQTMIDSIHAYNESIKIMLWLCPFPSSLFISDLEKKRVFEQHKLLIKNYDNRISDNIYLVEVGACIDTVYDMQYEEVPINDNEGKTFLKGTDRIHPSNNGYYTISDIMYSAIKYNVD